MARSGTNTQRKKGVCLHTVSVGHKFYICAGSMGGQGTATTTLSPFEDSEEVQVTLQAVQSQPLCNDLNRIE